MIGRRLGILLAVIALALGAAGCNWTMFGYGPSHTHFTPDKAINAKNVSKLAQLLTGQTSGQVNSPPATSNGIVYVGSEDHRLYAFDANGASNCSGKPNRCSPLWTATTGAGIQAGPAVVGGVVYVNSEDDNLYAFDAKGNINCSGVPKVCTPLWTAPTFGSFSSPTVANGVVYTGGEFVSAFDAHGITNCSGTPKVCMPLWASAFPFPTFNSSPSMANGVLYASGEDDKLYAFDANGNTNCSGTPKKCSPLWTAIMGTTLSDSTPAVAGGVVYVGSNDAKLYAFDANGNTNCSGTPKACSPLWTAATPGPFLYSSPAVAKGVVYTGARDLEAFDAHGMTNCAGTPKTCTPLWTGTVDVMESSPSVENGLVFIGSFSNTAPESFGVEAFDATGTKDCSGSPKTCTQLWAGVTGSPVFSSPAVANGKVYAGDGLPIFSDDKLYAWALP
jgi:outer membrane protein assembly factor BamB